MNVLGWTEEVLHELLEVSTDLLRFAPIPGLEEAARTLGAGPWAAFRRVTWPLLWRGMLPGAAAVFVFVAGSYEAAALGWVRICLRGTSWNYARARAVLLPRSSFKVDLSPAPSARSGARGHTRLRRRCQTGSGTTLGSSISIVSTLPLRACVLELQWAVAYPT